MPLRGNRSCLNLYLIHKHLVYASLEKGSAEQITITQVEVIVDCIKIWNNEGHWTWESVSHSPLAQDLFTRGDVLY